MALQTPFCILQQFWNPGNPNCSDANGALLKWWHTQMAIFFCGYGLNIVYQTTPSKNPFRGGSQFYFVFFISKTYMVCRSRFVLNAFLVHPYPLNFSQLSMIFDLGPQNPSPLFWRRGQGFCSPVLGWQCSFYIDTVSWSSTRTRSVLLEESPGENKLGEISKKR